jgi:hypothetical protein
LGFHKLPSMFLMQSVALYQGPTGENRWGQSNALCFD